MSKKCTFVFEKLVRDKLISIYQAEGATPNYRILPDAEYEAHLKKKLFEEAQELVEESDKDAVVAEFADVYEVLSALAHFYNISQKDIEEKRQSKNQQRGAFAQRVYLESVTVENPDKPPFAYLKANPHKYPEK